MNRRILAALLATVLALGIVATAGPTGANVDRPVAPLSNGNLSSVDNCNVAKLIMQADGRLPGAWTLYDAYRWVSGDPSVLIFYRCRFFSFTWGFATIQMADSDAVYGGNGFWSFGSLAFDWTYRYHWQQPYDAQMCHGTYVAGGHSCAYWE